MAEMMISREDAADLGKALHRYVDELEAAGFERGQIGAAMAGIGVALVQIHDGHRCAIGILDSARNCLGADAAGQH